MSRSPLLILLLYVAFVYFAAMTPVLPDTCSGFFHRGICLRHSTTSTGTSDVIPVGCTPYQPNLNWTKLDYDAICQQITTSCTMVDTDWNGGRCSNFKAILAFESNTVPDVWVHRNTFSWDPSTSSIADDCQLVSNPPGIIVYACRLSENASVVGVN